ncbi:MAG: amidohydrolase [Bryobacteraceae bacterium]|jgi:predicted amidohydrolase YtcJ
MKAWYSIAIASVSWAQTADLAVIHAHIYTVDARQPRATAMAVRQGVIVNVSDDVARFIGPSTNVIDAHGATVIPGLIDAHGHVHALGDALEELDLRGTTSERAIADKVGAAARQRRAGEWIAGSAWDQNLWATKQFPDAAALSAVAPDNPVALDRVDGHAIWVNRKAMELADLNAATQDPPGGKILRDAAGQPTGVLLDEAQSLIRRSIPEPAEDQVERRMLRALRECARVGLTTVHDAGVGPREIEAYRSLMRKGEMPIRVYAMIAGANRSLLDWWIEKGPEIGDFLTVRSIKLIADGALGSRGAALRDPYSDDPGNRGLPILNRAAIREVAEKAVAKGFQLNTHAIGDAANRAAIDAYGDVLQGPNDKRFRIEHAQVVAPEDFAKFKKYSAIASMQATHATSDMAWAEARVGPERIKGAYAWRTFLRLGVHVANGSDFPVESPNPMLGLYAAITRGGWMPEQRMSREEALRSWTLEGAYAAFEEKRKGSLEAGKLADFVMLSDDVMTMPADDIPKTRATMTVVGGKIVARQ